MKYSPVVRNEWIVQCVWVSGVCLARAGGWGRGSGLGCMLSLGLLPALMTNGRFVNSAGVLFNPVTPEWLQTLLLAALLAVVVRKTFEKGFKQWRSEQATEQHAARSAALPALCTPVSSHCSSVSSHCSFHECHSLYLRRSCVAS